MIRELQDGSEHLRRVVCPHTPHLGSLVESARAKAGGDTRTPNARK
jgi:hypothetical protein